MRVDVRGSVWKRLDFIRVSIWTNVIMDEFADIDVSVWLSVWVWCACMDEFEDMEVTIQMGIHKTAWMSLWI